MPEAGSAPADRWESTSIHYRLSAFGQDYYLNLTPETGFIAPLYTVTVLGMGNLTQHQEEYQEEEQEEETVYRHCFYKGHVNGETEHTAVISLCSGLVSSHSFSGSNIYYYKYYIITIIKMNFNIILY